MKKYTYKQWQETVTSYETKSGISKERVKKIPNTLIVYETDDDLMEPLDDSYGVCFWDGDAGCYFYDKQVGDTIIRTHQWLIEN